MRVLYLGCYRDGTGWASAALQNILALDAAGVDVVPRAVKLNDHQGPVPERVRELESRPSSGCDVVVQHLLPHHMEYDGHFALNVGCYHSETSDFAHSFWPERLNQMDLLLVSNQQMTCAAKRSGVVAPTEVVPVPADVSRYARSHKPYAPVQALKDQGKFVFYTVGEMVRRKNHAALLRAFHLEFAPEEPVALVIKATKPGLNAGELEKHLRAFCSEIKKGLKLYPDEGDYHREVLVTERLTDEALLGLHYAADCFVQPSYGEAWSIPAFDAMALGKTPVVTDCTGYRDYLPGAGLLVARRPEPVFGVEEFPDLFTGRENWWQADVDELRTAMRRLYEEESLRKDMARAGLRRAFEYSHQAVGARLRKVLEQYVQKQENEPLGGAA